MGRLLDREERDLIDAFKKSLWFLHEKTLWGGHGEGEHNDESGACNS